MMRRMTSNRYQHLYNAVAERPEEVNEWEAAHWQGFEYTSDTPLNPSCVTRQPQFRKH
jgi:hypothetical protein